MNTTRNPTNPQLWPPAPLWRRFAALTYDTFIVISFILLATTIALIMNRGASLQPFQYLFLAYLVLSTGLFLGWFWHRSGQTLGMLAWKLCLVDKQCHRLSWSRVALRYTFSLLSVGCAGIGFLWCFLDPEGQTLHDRLAGTKAVKCT